MMLVLLAVPALHRAGSFFSGTFDARDVSLHMIFPKDYSAFGLASEQKPARGFVTISVMLRLGGSLSLFPLFVAPDMFGFTLYGHSTQNSVLPEYDDGDINFTLALAFELGFLAFICVSCCAWCFLPQCFCVGNDFSGAAEADRGLQERVDDRARILAARMREADLKPTWKEYVMLHVEMMFFAWDFVSDGLAAWKFFELELFGFFAFQLVIILMTLWEESRVVRKLGIRAVYLAVAESSLHGWATDNLLAIMMQEKLIEAPCSSILFLLASVQLPQSAERNLFPIKIMYLFSLFKLFTSSYSCASAAYVFMHLDLDRHIAVAMEGLELPSARGAEKSSCMPVQPTQAHGRPQASSSIGRTCSPCRLSGTPTGNYTAACGSYPAFPPGIVPPPAAPTPSAPCLQGGGLKHMPAQERPDEPVQVPALESRPADASTSLRLSMPPLPPIQVGAPRGAVDQE